jgi:lipoprotein NlpI
MQVGRFGDALADYDRLVELDPGNGWIKGERGKLRFIVGDFDGAMNDMDIAERAAPQDEDILLWRYFAYRRAGDAATLSVRDGEGWRAMMQRLIVGETTQDIFFAFAEDRERNGQLGARASGAFWMGEIALLNGNTTEASALFRRAAALAATADIIMRCAAQAELSRLEPRGDV